jgi:hypothetical protein
MAGTRPGLAKFRVVFCGKIAQALSSKSQYRRTAETTGINSAPAPGSARYGIKEVERRFGDLAQRDEVRP